MFTAADLARLFPHEGDIPAEHRPPGPIEQREWLIAGELRPWAGETQPVLSRLIEVFMFPGGVGRWRDPIKPHLLPALKDATWQRRLGVGLGYVEGRRASRDLGGAQAVLVECSINGGGR